MKTVLLPVYLFLFVIMLGACTGDNLDNFQRSLDSNRTLWEENGLEGYALRYSFSSESFQYQSILVDGGQVNSAFNEYEKKFISAGDLQSLAKVEEMFDLVQEAIDRKADHLLVSYNPDLGYPEKVFVNFDYAESSDEESFEVYQFDYGAHVESQFKLNVALRQWQPQHIKNYSFDFNLSCECSSISYASVVVADNLVAAATDVDNVALPPSEVLTLSTIDDFYTLIQEAIDNEVADMWVEFNETTGQPLQISIDSDAFMLDDDFAYTFTELAYDSLLANQNKLTVNRALWRSQDRDSYWFALTSNTLPESDKYYIYVEDGLAQEGIYVDVNDQWVDFDPLVVLERATVEDYFSLIQAAIDSAADLRVEYHQQFGYPQDIYINNPISTHEEILFSLDSLTFGY